VELISAVVGASITINMTIEAPGGKALPRIRGKTDPGRRLLGLGCWWRRLLGLLRGHHLLGLPEIVRRQTSAFVGDHGTSDIELIISEEKHKPVERLGKTRVFESPCIQPLSGDDQPDLGLRSRPPNTSGCESI
jgi:hypothetical protein